MRPLLLYDSSKRARPLTTVSSHAQANRSRSTLTTGSTAPNNEAPRPQVLCSRVSVDLWSESRAYCCDFIDDKLIFVLSLAAAVATLGVPSLRLRRRVAVAALVRVTRPAGQSAALEVAREQLREEEEDARVVMGDEQAGEEGPGEDEAVVAAVVVSGSRRSRNREETSMPSSRRS